MAINKLFAGNVGNPANSKGSDVANAVNALIDIADTVGVLADLPCLSTGKLMSKIKSGSGGTILVVSDSTGTLNVEWVYRLAQQLATDYDSLSVNYYLWDTATNGYASAVVFGGGSVIVNIYNAAVSGSRPSYFYGSRYATMVAGITTLDLVIINHGHNLITQSSDSDTLHRRAPQMLEMPAMLSRQFPGFGLMFLSQNPRRDDNNYEPMYRTIVDAAGMCNADIADSYLEFLSLNKPASFYYDNTHPSAEGQNVFLKKVYNFFTESTHKPVNDFIDQCSNNLIPNGDFVDYHLTVPVGFELVGLTCDKETTIKETGAYSLKLTTLSHGSLPNIRINVPNFRNYANSVITFAARIYIPDTNNDANSGLVGLTSTTRTANNTSGGSGKGGWHWRFISLSVKPSDSFVQALVYAGSATTAGSIIYLDRIVLVKGRLPNDNAPTTSNRDGVDIVGDVSTTLAIASSSYTQLYQTPLSTNRLVNLPTLGVKVGDGYRIVRTAASTGSNLTEPTTGKVIGPATWCDFMRLDSEWIVIASGSV